MPGRIEVAGRKQQQEGMKKRRLQRVKRGYEKLCILLSVGIRAIDK